LNGWESGSKYRYDAGGKRQLQLRTFKT